MKILDAKHRFVRLHNIKQLGDYGCHALKVARATRTAEYIGHGWHYHTGLLGHTIGVDFFFIGAKQVVATYCLQFGRISCQGAWVFIPIFIQAKLQRVDKNTGHYHIAIALGDFHQLDMGAVQVAHSRHKTNTFTGFALGRQGFTKGLNVMKNLHITASNCPSTELGFGRAIIHGQD